MNSLLLTFAIFSNPAPAIDVNEWIDLNTWRQELHMQIVKEADEVSDFLRHAVRQGISQMRVLEVAEPDAEVQTAATQGK